MAIIIKPIVTEKMTAMADKLNRYGFRVCPDANKLQIKKAVEEIFPTAKIQRCLTHIQIQVKNCISNNPKSDCGKELQKIITFEKF